MRGGRLLRASGVAAAVLWAELALAERLAWPRLGLIALGLSAAVVLAARPLAEAVPRVLMALQGRVFVSICAAAAAGISWRMAHVPLRDMPLTIDSSVYLLQARAMAHLHFGLPAPLPCLLYTSRCV